MVPGNHDRSGKWQNEAVHKEFDKCAREHANSVQVQGRLYRKDLSKLEFDHELGYEVYPMEIIAAGEESYAAMKRSTNGGGENSPMAGIGDDLYEDFFPSLGNGQSERSLRLIKCESIVLKQWTWKTLPENLKSIQYKDCY